jgi:hypothetical protein
MFCECMRGAIRPNVVTHLDMTPNDESIKPQDIHGNIGEGQPLPLRASHQHQMLILLHRCQLII